MMRHQLQIVTDAKYFDIRRKAQAMLNTIFEHGFSAPFEGAFLVIGDFAYGNKSGYYRDYC